METRFLARHTKTINIVALLSGLLILISTVAAPILESGTKESSWVSFGILICIGIISGNLLALGPVTIFQERAKLLSAVKISLIITLIFILLFANGWSAQESNFAVFLLYPLYCFSVFFTVGVLGAFSKIILPTTNELVFTLVLILTLWETAMLYSLAHPLFVIGSMFGLMIFGHLMTNKPLTKILRGVCIVALHIYFFSTYGFLFLEHMHTIRTGITLQSIGQFLHPFGVGVFTAFLLLHGMFIFEFLLYLLPVKFLTGQQHVARNFLIALSTKFTESQFSIKTLLLWSVLLIAVLFLNETFSLTSPYFITVLAMTIATYKRPPTAHDAILQRSRNN